MKSLHDEHGSAGRTGRRAVAAAAGLVTVACVSGITGTDAATFWPSAAGMGAASVSGIASFSHVRLVYRAVVSDSDSCNFTNGPTTEFCASDASFEGGTEHLIRSFSAEITSVVPISPSGGLNGLGQGTGAARESSVSLSASNTYSAAQNGPGSCTGMTGSNTEAYAGTSTAGTLTVDGLRAVRDAHGLLTDFRLSLRAFNESGPGENVTVSDNITAADEQACVGTFTNPFTELFGSSDVDIVHDEAGLLNETTGDVLLSHWTINPKWPSLARGVLATKIVKATGKFNAPDSGLIHLVETLQLEANVIASCTLRIFNPHKSGHNPGHTNVASRIDCTQAVPAVRLVVQLFRNRAKLITEQFRRHNTALLKGHAAYRCRGLTDRYHGAAKAVVTWPAGAFPPFGKGTVQSPVVRIKC